MEQKESAAGLQVLPKLASDATVSASMHDPLVDWVQFVDQDSQSETLEFLDESAAKHSGE